MTPAGGRNTSFVVHGRRSRSYFVKRGAPDQDRDLIAGEATAYERLGDVSELRPHLVTYVGFAEREAALVLQYVEPRPGTPHLVPELARGAGIALARLHRQAPALLPGEPTRPYALSLHRPALDDLPHLSEATLDCVRMVQGADGLTERLDAVAASWSADGIAHNDVRFANVLWPTRPRSSVPKLVDWELAGPGDTAWDVGCYLADHVLRWVASIPIAEGDKPFLHARHASEPIDSARAPMRAFWEAYCEERPAARDPDWLEHTMRMLAARVVMGAVERSQLSAAVGMSAVGMLQLAENVLSAPLDFARGVAGLA